MSAAPGRVLVVRVGRMGDMVMITPALRMLLAGLPGAEIELLTSPDGRRVLKGFDPRITSTHLYSRRFLESLIARRRLRRELEAKRFARVYVFETHSHYRTLVRGLAPEIHGLEAAPRSTHYSARCLDAVEPTLAAPAPRGWLELPVAERGRQAAREYLAAHGVGEADRLVGLHLTFSETSRGAFASGRGRKHREWRLEAAVELARRLAAAGEAAGTVVRPVIDALPEERPMAEALRERSGGAVTVLTGAPDFERYKALLARLAVLVTPNTGPMHVAAAVGTPVVALFSGWSPAECGPFVPPDRAAVLRAEDEPGGEAGLAAIGPARVFDACARFLGAGNG